jgi:hypothetical protein
MPTMSHIRRIVAVFAGLIAGWGLGLGLSATLIAFEMAHAGHSMTDPNSGLVYVNYPSRSEVAGTGDVVVACVILGLGVGLLVAAAIRVKPTVNAGPAGSPSQPGLSLADDDESPGR